MYIQENSLEVIASNRLLAKVIELVFHCPNNEKKPLCKQIFKNTYNDLALALNSKHSISVIIAMGHVLSILDRYEGSDLRHYTFKLLNRLNISSRNVLSMRTALNNCSDKYEWSNMDRVSDALFCYYLISTEVRDSENSFLYPISSIKNFILGIYTFSDYQYKYADNSTCITEYAVSVDTCLHYLMFIVEDLPYDDSDKLAVYLTVVKIHNIIDEISRQIPDVDKCISENTFMDLMSDYHLSLVSRSKIV